MSTDTPTITTPGNAKAARSNLHETILAIAADCVSRQAFFSEALKCIARETESPFAAISIQFASDIIEDQQHTGNTDPNFWRPMVEDYLTIAIGSGQPQAKLLSARHSSLQLGLIAVPVRGAEGTVVGGLSLVARMSEEDVRVRVTMMESAAALMMHAARGIEKDRVSGARRTMGQNRALAKAATCETPEELAFTIANSLRNNLGCEHVAIGIVRRRRVRILSVSGQDEIHGDSPGMLAIQQAMEECLDFGRPIVYQAQQPLSSEGERVGFCLHRSWHQVAKNAPVSSIPLRIEDRCVAILSIQHRESASFSPEVIRQISETVQPFGAAFLLLQKASRSLPRHAVEVVGGVCRALANPRHHGARIALAAGAALACWLVLGTLEHTVYVNFTVQPGQLRHVSLPYDATLADVRKTAGDRVAKGEILCQLDERELGLQRAERLAELAVAEQEAQRAKATKTPVDARLAETQVELIRAQLAVVESRIERATIRSPMDGVVIEGDLRTKVGSIMSQGAPLFRIAPLKGWKLELRVPEAAISGIRPGLSGRYACHARPETSYEFQLSRLQPNAVVRDGEVAFVAEAELENAPAWARPGMEGVARISVGRRPAWWVMFHSAVDYVRLRLWL
ncbi:MAG: HlyD family efflux transporter periplasmic adaptor subunit [Phycisphaerae bacterium]|nr:HlyD family efflux transporter periplasmic adaptor subunit [Phycisphaerae bacterium]